MCLQKVFNFYMTNIHCQIYIYVKFVAITCSGWVLVLITLDRVIKIGQPHKAIYFCTNNKFKVFLVVILTLICTCYIPVPVFISSHDLIIFSGNVFFTVETYCAFTKATVEYFRVSHMLTHSLIPFAVMLFGTIIIIVCLYKTIKTRGSLKHTEQDHSELDRVITLAISLFAINITYLILTLPYVLYTVLIKYARNMYGSNDKFYNLQYIFYVCSMSCEYINNTINFVMYCLAGKPYRDELLLIMRCCVITIIDHDTGITVYGPPPAPITELHVL